MLKLEPPELVPSPSTIGSLPSYSQPSFRSARRKLLALEGPSTSTFSFPTGMRRASVYHLLYSCSPLASQEDRSDTVSNNVPNPVTADTKRFPTGRNDRSISDFRAHRAEEHGANKVVSQLPYT